MHIDIFSAIIFNITSSFFIGLSLFFVSCGYLGEIKGIKLWTAGLMLQSVGWILTALAKAYVLDVLLPIAASATLLSVVFYLQAIVEFKEIKISIKWAYYLALISSILLLSFKVILDDVVIRICITSLCGFFLTFALGGLLLSKRYSVHNEIPRSHQITGYIFIICGIVAMVRAIYFFLFPPTQGIFTANLMQDLMYLTFHIVICVSAFSFLLMCSDKYFGMQKQVENDLRIAATAFQTQEGIMITDATSVILNVNKAFTEITGYLAEQVIGQTPRILQSGGHDKEFYTAMWNTLLNEGAWQGEVWNKRKNGQIYPQYLTITAVKNDGAVTNYVSTITDITDRKANENTIRNLSFYDSLTELPNRRLLEQRIKHAIEINRLENKKIAVLMMDLDKFKAVNDTLGHKAGDDLLKQVAVRIQACLPEKEMVARLGGDEFVVVLEDVNALSDIEDIANAVIQMISQPFTLFRGDVVYIGVSIGIAICIHPMHGYDVDTLLDHADIALYHSKDNGAGCFTYFSEEFLAS